jgi:hypothetical protein
MMYAKPMPCRKRAPVMHIAERVLFSLHWDQNGMRQSSGSK